MSDRFDIRPLKTRTKLLLEVSDDTLAAACANSERLSTVLDVLTSHKVLTVERDAVAGLQRFMLQAKPMALYSDAPQAVVGVYQTLYGAARHIDPRLPIVDMSIGPVDSIGSRHGMHVEARWPEMDAAEAAQFATTCMRQFASSMPAFAQYSPRFMEEMVYVRARRTEGIVIETNPVGSCSIGSQAADYTDEPTVNLFQHNIYNPQQQLICLVGAVALANADQHVKST